LVVRFVDWREHPVAVEFTDVIEVRWQEADSTGPEDRNDCTFEIEGSEWLAEHLRQQVAVPSDGHRHFRLCFNAAGVLDVLAVSVVPGS
jgi:hypothetical protein